MESWSTAEVCCFIEAKGFEKDVTELFRANRIRGEVLPLLTDTDLKELGVAALGDRKLLLKLFEPTTTMLSTVNDSISTKKHTEKVIQRVYGHHALATNYFAYACGQLVTKIVYLIYS